MGDGVSPASSSCQARRLPMVGLGYTELSWWPRGPMEITKHPQPVKTKGCSPELRAATPLPRATFTKRKKKKKNSYQQGTRSSPARLKGIIQQVSRWREKLLTKATDTTTKLLNSGQYNPKIIVTILSHLNAINSNYFNLGTINSGRGKARSTGMTLRNDMPILRTMPSPQYQTADGLWTALSYFYPHHWLAFLSANKNCVLNQNGFRVICIPQTSMHGTNSYSKCSS